MNPDFNEQRRFATEVVTKLRAAGHTALWAGGCVRDLLLGQTPKDFDVATSAQPAEVRQLFHRTLAIGAAFGVVQVRGKHHEEVEVATFRADGEYLDGRHPKSIRFADAAEDARRRDFTINGMFFDPLENRVIDFVGGEADLFGKVIRAIGAPHLRFTEDKLRLLRAIRFAARLGFSIEPVTYSAVREMANQLLVVSAERIHRELRLILQSPTRAVGFRLLRETKLFEVIFPELEAVFQGNADAENQMETRLAKLPADPSFALVLAILLSPFDDARAVELAGAICGRLKTSNDDLEATQYFVKHRQELVEADLVPVAKLKRRLADIRILDLLHYLRAVGHESAAKFCQDYLASHSAQEICPPVLITGNDLCDLGLRPGPQFRIWLEEIRDLQLSGGITTPTEALAKIKELAGLPADR